MPNLIQRLNKLLNYLSTVDFLAPLERRLYSPPIFWVAGSSKLRDMESTIAWFGNPDWGLGLPLPALMAWLASLKEVGGAFLLLVGFSVRWVWLPLMVTILFADLTVRSQCRSQAIAEFSGIFAIERTMEAAGLFGRAKDILQENGNHGWLAKHGNFVALNNGIEFSATYFIKLLALLYLGSGKGGVDYCLNRKFDLRL